MKFRGERFWLESEPGQTREEWPADATHWTVTLGYGMDYFKFPFSMGSAYTGEPDLLDVLECVVSDANAGTYTFHEFCDEFGYDTDSRKAYATWEACQETRDKLTTMVSYNAQGAVWELFEILDAIEEARDAQSETAQ